MKLKTLAFATLVAFGGAAFAQAPATKVETKADAKAEAKAPAKAEVKADVKADPKKGEAKAKGKADAKGQAKKEDKAATPAVPAKPARFVPRRRSHFGEVHDRAAMDLAEEIGRASCRERVWRYV